MNEKNWRKLCVSLMIEVEVKNNRKVQNQLTKLGRQAILENTTIYEKIKEVIIEYHKHETNTSTKRL